MSQNLHLIIHNALSVISAFVTLGMALFLFVNGKKRTGSRALSLTMLFVAVFIISHVIGVNISDPIASKTVLLFNLCMFLIASTNIHSILTMIGEDKNRRAFIWFFYISSIALVIFFIIFPNLFLLPSSPKMYFPNYYVPGDYNWVRIAFLYIIAVPYMVYVLVKAHGETESKIDKSHYSYLTFVIIIGYFVAFLPNFLVYDIAIDPLWGMSFAILFAIPLTYAAIKYELFNIKIVAKQALLYAIGVVVVGGIIILFNYLDSWIINTFPGYPTGATAIISSLLAVAIGGITWNNMKKGDLLKYEFITTVSHKFRTPLTGIKWATESLSAMDLPPKAVEQITYIKNSSEKLVELTDLLINTSSSENQSYKYNPVRDNLSTEAVKVIESLSKQIQIKKTNLVKNIEPDLYVKCDIARIRFVMQSFIENAIHYTDEGGIILVKVKKIKNEVVFSVQDRGIGIDKKEIPMIFEKFYRTTEARTADTEGMGIGLFISKEIIKYHKGRVWVESEGIDQGSTFYFSLPLVK